MTISVNPCLANIQNSNLKAKNPSFTSAFANIDGELVNLIGKTDRSTVNDFMLAQNQKGVERIKLLITNAINKKTGHKTLKPIQVILTGGEAEMYREAEAIPGTLKSLATKKTIADYTQCRSKNMILDFLLGSRAKLNGVSSILEQKNSTAAAAQNTSRFVKVA